MLFAALPAKADEPCDKTFTVKNETDMIVQLKYKKCTGEIIEQHISSEQKSFRGTGTAYLDDGNRMSKVFEIPISEGKIITCTDKPFNCE